MYLVKNGECYTFVGRLGYSLPTNANLYSNGTLDLIPTNRGYQSFIDTTKRLQDITFFADIDATFTFSVNGVMCSVGYQIHTRHYDKKRPLTISQSSLTDPRFGADF